MQAVKVGQLFQYTQEHYGKFYSKLPKVPFSLEYSRLETSWKKQIMMSWSHAGTEDLETKKYTLFAAKVVTVCHPRTEVAKCDYVFCFISDPYQAGETRDGWVRTEWIEPLNAFRTYEAEELNILHNSFKEMKERRKKMILEKELTPLEIFQQMKGRKR